MNTRIINSIIKAKMRQWLETVADQELRSDMEKGLIVTGGAIASLLMREEVKDYDVYFTSKSLAKRVALYYVTRWNEAHKDHKNRLGFPTTAFVLDGEDVEKWQSGELDIEKIAPGYSNQGSQVSRMVAGTTPDRIKVIVRSDGVAAENGDILNSPFEDAIDAMQAADEIHEKELEKTAGENGSKEKFRPVFLSTNAITLSEKIQIVVRFYGDAETIHSNYDFVHCTNYWTFRDGLVLRQQALESILAKELRYSGSKYPVCSIIRTRKFLKRGWNINAGQYLKMCFQVSALDLKNVDTLEDQLVGVDSAYFMAVIFSIRQELEKDATFSVDNEYISTVIDKIF